jgi:hypothetical protein
VQTYYFPKASHDLGKQVEPELRAFLCDNLLDTIAPPLREDVATDVDLNSSYLSQYDEPKRRLVARLLRFCIAFVN